jgi:hypothetical protein
MIQQVKTPKMPTKRASRAEVDAAMSSFSPGTPISSFDFKKLTGIPPTRVAYFYGSWEAGQTKFGLNRRATQQWTEEDLINEIKRVSELLGGVPSRRAFEDNSSVGYDPIKRCFGGWTPALVRAGLSEFSTVFGKKPDSEKRWRKKSKQKAKNNRFELLRSLGQPVRREGSQTQFLVTRLTAKALSSDKISPIFLPEHTFDWLVNPKTGRKLRLDAFFPGLDLAVEYQSELHFTEYENGSLGDTVYRDYIKRQLLAQNGIRLLEIAYFEPLTIDYIQQKLKNLGWL